MSLYQYEQQVIYRRQLVAKPSQLTQSIAFSIVINSTILVHPEQQALIRWKWNRRIKEIGAYPIRDVIDPTKPIANIRVNEFEWWSFRKVGRTEIIEVPTPIYDRCMQAKNRGIPFSGWVLGEQHVIPKIQVEYYKVRVAPGYLDPALFGVLPVSENVAILVLMGCWMEEH